MTSKDNSEPASRGAIIAFRERRDRHALITEGLLPGLDELFAGAPWFGGSMDRDIQTWCDSTAEMSLWRRGATGPAAKVPLPKRLKSAISVLRDTCNPIAIEAVRLELEAVGHDDAWRMRVYQSCLGNEDASQALALQIARETAHRDGFEGLFREAVLNGLMLMNSRKSMSDYCDIGLRFVAGNGDLLRDFNRARVEVADEAKAAAKASDAALAASEIAKVNEMMAALRGVDPDDEEWERAVAEGRVEDLNLRRQLAVIVVPEMSKKSGSTAKKEMAQAWEGLAGQPLPIVQRGDIAGHRRRLVEQWPHAADVIDTILGDLAAREAVRFRPTILVGSKGSGKSSLARAICDAFGLPVELYSMAGMADSSLSGTSAQWSNARESIPLQLIKRSKTASVAMIWDEIEKASESRHNGSALDALLPMLEIGQARNFRDLALEVEVDLSHVTHFATANSTSELSAPLRDRFRILHVPEPTWAHLGTLTRQIIDRVAAERGIDSRWFAPLAEDELDLVRATWPGGSIRKLSRIVQTIIDGRESIMGRC